MPASRVFSKIRLIRPLNCLMMGFAVLVGAYLARAGLDMHLHHLRNLALGFVTGFCLCGASMALNDYFDRFIDAVNQPDRPIPSGLVKPSEALAYAGFLILLGLASALLTGWACLLVALAAMLLSLGYVAGGKRLGLPGNLMVSGCVAIPFIYGAFAVHTLNPNNLIFASMALLANTGREITKGIVDVPGDRLYGVRTLAVSRGERLAAWVASAFYLSAVMLSVVPWMLRLASPWYLLLVSAADLGFLYSTISLLRRPSGTNALRVKREVLLWMFLGLVAFLMA